MRAVSQVRCRRPAQHFRAQTNPLVKPRVRPAERKRSKGLELPGPQVSLTRVTEPAGRQRNSSAPGHHRLRRTPNQPLLRSRGAVLAARGREHWINRHGRQNPAAQAKGFGGPVPKIGGPAAAAAVGSGRRTAWPDQTAGWAPVWTRDSGRPLRENSRGFAETRNAGAIAGVRCHPHTATACSMQLSASRALARSRPWGGKGGAQAPTNWARKPTPQAFLISRDSRRCPAWSQWGQRNGRNCGMEPEQTWPENKRQPLIDEVATHERTQL